MIVALRHTTNFVIKYDNKLKDGLRRAKALKSSCEADFKQLRTWFTATGGFGTKNPRDRGQSRRRQQWPIPDRRQ
jgi:hypothetical protein